MTLKSKSFFSFFLSSFCLILSLETRAEVICNRHPDVVAALVKNFNKPCTEISAEDLTRVVSLRVNSSAPGALRATDLAGLPNLRDLIFSDLESVKKGTLRDLIQLKKLVFFSADSNGLSSELFAGLTQLEQLEIWNPRQLQQIPARAFVEMPKLKKLFLGVMSAGGGAGGNALHCFASDSFAGLTELEELYLGVGLDLRESADLCPGEMGKALVQLPAQLLRGLDKLQKFHLVGVPDVDQYPVAVPAESFSPEFFAHSPELKVLKLIVMSNVQALDAKFFLPLPKLETFVMSESVRLSSVALDTFDGLSHLKSVDLSRAWDLNVGSLEFRTLVERLKQRGITVNF